MQTFLPYSDFCTSASCLDYRRLGKQRLEAKQILLTLKNGSGWINHPAVKMWKGYETALMHYYNVVVNEWIKRGYNNSMPFLFHSLDFEFPHWLGRKDFHASHRSNLLRKDFKFYSKYDWKEPTDLPYVWPS